MALAFAFLLTGFAARFLALAALQVFAVFFLTVIFGGAGFAERDGDRLLAAFHLAAFAAAAALQFAVLIFVHHAADGLALTWAGFGHRFLRGFSKANECAAGGFRSHLADRK